MNIKSWWMKEARHKNAYGMIPYIYKILEKANKSIVMKSVSGGWGEEKEESFEGVGNVLYFDFSGGLVCIYSCQKSSILNFKWV